MARDISSSDDTIDVRDVIERVEELREMAEAENWNTDQDSEDYDPSPDQEELITLERVMDDLKGNGGDEQWEGAWYPGNLIRETYFVDAMQELVQDIGDLPRDIPSYLEIDWEKTAENLRADYSSVEFDGVTYWYR